MKRNIFQRLYSWCGRPVVLTVLLAGGLSVACSDDMADSGLGKPLPEGSHPVITTARIQAVSQANGIEPWAGGEQIAVQAVSSPDGWADAETGIYEASSSDSLLTASKPVWWKYSGEMKKIRAWYCGDGSTAEKGENAAGVPSSWTVKADQSGDGYNESRLLFAPVKKTVFALSRIVPMRLYHQTARVVMNFNEEERNAIASMTVKNMTLSGNWSAPETEGVAVGAWTEDAEAGKADITLRKLDLPEGTALVSFAGLVVPQEMAGLEVTVRTAEGTELTTTLAPDAEALVAGKSVTYKCRIKDGQLSVEAPKVIKEYKAEDLKYGDWFYNDGTWSDGGLRLIYSDGSVKMERQNPVAGKQVVGIVFQTDPDRIGQAEKDSLAAKGVVEPHGLVMSLKNAATGVKWGPATDETGLQHTQVRSELYDDISGYANSLYIWKTYKDNLADYPAFKAAADYNNEETGCPVSGNTTGWFLPSAGQTWDMLQILGDCEPLADPANQESGASGWQHEFKGMDGYLDRLNEWMGPVIDSNKDKFENGKRLGTSSERSNANAWCWDMKPADLFLMGETKTDKYKVNVRPVLAF